MSGASTTTFLLTDIEGSTRNWEAGEAVMRGALARHDAILSRIIVDHAGRVLTERGEGDSFFALFGVASDAVAAALDLQRTLAEEPWPDRTPIRVRMAIHTGEAGPDQRGPDVNRCARLRAIARGGQVLLSATTANLVRGRLPAGASLQDLGPHRLRDLTIPERVFQLAHPDIPSAFPPLASLDSFRHNLPIQISSFVGRTAELATVASLLGEHRLVTLTGSGGSGKTRLAVQVAAELIDAFEDGVWFADLAPISDPALVAATVAAAAGVAEIPGRSLVATLADQLGGRRTILVIDNCEHLMAAAADLVDRLLRHAAGIRILATSQEALNVPGEIVWRVPSLSVPDAALPPRAETVARSESVQLFLDRAAAIQSRLVLTDANAEVIAQICRRLDGVPLAIELAAARVKMLAPDELLRRLEDRFRLLTGGNRTALPRQQTLRATVEWSHELLGPAERVLFRRLAVFVGGFDLGACEAVCGGDPIAAHDVLDILARLVDRSMVIAEPDEHGVVRYLLLETLRQYGRERLEEAGEMDSLADAHLRHFIEVAEHGYERRIDDEAVGLATLERELENLRTALDRSLATNPDDELRLAGALSWFWALHTAHASEGRARLAHALGERDERTARFARALAGAAMTENWAGDPRTSANLAERAVAIWRELGDDRETGLAYEALGWARQFGSDGPGSLEAMRQSVAYLARVGDRRLLNRANVGLGQALVALGDVKAVVPLATETLRIGRELDARRDIHYSLHFLGDCALHEGDGDAAASWYRQSLAAALSYGNVAEAALELEGFAMARAAQGRPAAALRLDAAAVACMESLGFDISTVEFWNRFKARYLEPARQAIGASYVAEMDAQGPAMGWEAATGEVLETD